MPKPLLVKFVRDQTRSYQRLYTALRRDPLLDPLLASPQATTLARGLRSAAPYSGVSMLYQRRLRRSTAVLVIPVIVAANLALVSLGEVRWHLLPSAAQLTWSTLLQTVCTVWLLILIVVLNRSKAYFISSMCLALAGACIMAVTTRPPDVMIRLLIIICMAPSATYAAFLPFIASAQVVAWRLSSTVDPRARIILGLARCTATAVKGEWRRRGGARDSMLRSIEQVARTAERDFARIMHRTGSDASTSAWLREQGWTIAARLRQCKQIILLPDPDAVRTVAVDLCELLILACSDKWTDFHANATPPKWRNLAPAILRRLGAAALFCAVALVMPWVLRRSLTPQEAENLRDVLLVAAATLLVPLPMDVVQRIPDTFSDVLNH
jgi:hypothetical protein